MVKLITLLVAGIPAIVGSILAQWSRKWVTVTASLALLAGMTATFVAVINGLVGALSSSLVTPSWISNAVGMFMPSNFGLVLASICSAHVARAVYDMGLERLRLFNNAT